MVWRADWTLVVAIIAVALPILGILVYLFIRILDQSAKRSYETTSPESTSSHVRQTLSEDY